MKKAITLTTTWTREWMKSSDVSSVSGMSGMIKKFASSLTGLFYNFLGFAVLLGLWQMISMVTDGELPGPVATSSIFYELVSDPFYDYGPNDKGIAIQLLSSLNRVFTGFLLGSVFAIPVGLLMGANVFCRKIFYPIVQILKPVSPLAWFPIGLVAFQSASNATIFIIFGQTLT